MNNEIVFIVEMVVNFFLLLLCYKLFEKPGLFAWIVIATIIANIQVTVTISLFGMVATMGNVIYGSSFLATDILSERYGIKEARKGVLIGFFTTISVMIMMQLVIRYIPHSSDFMMEHVSEIFALFPRIVAGSLLAYLISQLHDTWAFDFWKRRFPRHLWLRNNVSTLVSQAIDTLLFVFVAFYGVFENEIILGIAFSTYVLKLVVAVCDTPFIYIASKIQRFVFKAE